MSADDELFLLKTTPNSTPKTTPTTTSVTVKTITVIFQGLVKHSYFSAGNSGIIIG